MMEERVTDWMDFGGSYGVSEYRIWKRFENGGWFQRHEYKLQNSDAELSKWIASAPGFIEGQNRADAQRD